MTFNFVSRALTKRITILLDTRKANNHYTFTPPHITVPMISSNAALLRKMLHILCLTSFYCFILF